MANLPRLNGVQRQAQEAGNHVWLIPWQAAAILGVHVNTLRNWTLDHRLAKGTVWMMSTGHRRYRLDLIQEYADALHEETP